VMKKAIAGFGLFSMMLLGVATAQERQNQNNQNQNQNNQNARNQNNRNQNAQNIRGQIVRVDPEKNIIVVRTGTGNTAREQELRVGTTTRYWGTDRQALTDGIRAKTFRPGADVWYQVGTGNNADTINELRFFDPTLNPNPAK